MPFLEDIYGKETDEFYEAMKRHSNFFNTTPMVNPFILALVVTMEYERKAAIDAGKEFDDNSIESLKVALMGPFAGIGDSIAVGVLRILATGIALGFPSRAFGWGRFCSCSSITSPQLADSMVYRNVGHEAWFKLRC